jgi:hypothetical protein
MYLAAINIKIDFSYGMNAAVMLVDPPHLDNRLFSVSHGLAPF